MEIIFIALVVIIVVAGGAIFIAASVQDWKVKKALHERGVTTQAQVVERHHEISRDLDDNIHTRKTSYYYISYRYEVNGTPYTRREHVDQTLYEILQDGSVFDVVYVPENPADARMASRL